MRDQLTDVLMIGHARRPVSPSADVHIHPSSVNSKTLDFLPFLVYLEKVKTSRVFIRCVRCIQQWTTVDCSAHSLTHSYPYWLLLLVVD